MSEAALNVLLVLQIIIFLNRGGKLTDISYPSCTVSVRADIGSFHLKRDLPVLFWYGIFHVLCLRQPFNSVLL